MKKFLSGIVISLSLVSCGGANDGDPTTDTSTTLPADPAVMNNGATDTATNINTNTGTYSRDSGNYTSTGDSSLPKKNDVRSSSSAYPDGRGAKKAGDSSRQ
jgi:hypothetical protein